MGFGGDPTTVFLLARVKESVRERLVASRVTEGTLVDFSKFVRKAHLHRLKALTVRVHRW